jgi:hypothetical protein
MDIDLVITVYNNGIAESEDKERYATFGTYNGIAGNRFSPSPEVREFITVGVVNGNVKTTIDITRDDWEMIKKAVEGTLS